MKQERGTQPTQGEREEMEEGKDASENMNCDHRLRQFSKQGKSLPRVSLLAGKQS
jgi:hypothetical protein